MKAIGDLFGGDEAVSTIAAGATLLRGFAEGDADYTLEALLGYVSKVAASGKVPLYRAYSAKEGIHLYTNDLNEYNNATSKLGYKAEGVVGYVNSSGINQCPTVKP